MSMRAAAFSSALMCIASPAFAYTPQWLECTGELTVTPVGGTPAKMAAKDIYVYDPDARNLFLYSQDYKRLSVLPNKTVSDQEFRWSGWSTDLESRQWEGRFNRAARTLTLSYKSDKESREWRQSCKPTDPKPES